MFKKIFLTLIVLLVLAVSGFAGFVFLARPLSRPPQPVTAVATPERLARGEYLAHATGCVDCHSERDFSRYSGPPKTPWGAKGLCFDKGVGVPGVVCPPNITPDLETGLGAWTDGEILRAMREGVSRDGRPLFPLMPYGDLKHLSDDDALSIVAYLRTLPPVAYKAPAAQLEFPLPIVIRFIPRPLEAPVAAPAKSDTVGYGRYLSTTMGCIFCHTTADAQMTPIPGREWAGDNEFRGPWGVVRSANLSPHPTGLGDRTRENFIGLFRAFGAVEGELPKGSQNTVMPWAEYNRLTDEDLGMIYDYLKTQKPVAQVVDRFPKTPRG
jgi:Cytochrome c